MMLPEAVTAQRPKWLAIGAVVVLLGLVVRVGWVTEDAYITLRTVDNWIHGYGLRWNIGERVQSYTHPLWMLLLSAGYFFTREAFFTTIFVGVATTAAAVLTLVHFARSAGHAVAAVLLLSMSRAFIDFSTSGLENPLSHLLIVVFIGLYATRAAPLWQLAVTAALLGTTRSDAILVVAPALAHAIWLEFQTIGLKQTARSLALGFLPLIAWEAFSLVYYGFPFPNTAYAKLNTGLPRLEVIQQGLVYWATALAQDPALHVVALAGVGAAAMQRKPRELLVALGLLLYTLYVINIGGDFMQGRFWTIPFFTGVCLLAIAPLPLEDPLRAFALVLPFFLLTHALTSESFARDFGFNGIADERAVYRDDMSLTLASRTRTMPTHSWAVIGRDLRARDEKVSVQSNVGLIGFFAGPGVHIIDPLALTDPLLARLPMRYSHDWRVGHYARHVPSGYVHTMAQGGAKCLMRDARLCEYYDHLHELIAGPLFSLSRLKTLLMMNLGRYDALISRERYRDPVVRQTSLAELGEPVADGAAWDSEGTMLVPVEGMTIDLPAASHAKFMEISFDGNDGYVLEFFNGKTLAAKFDSTAFERGPMRTRRIEIPEEARKQGFDQIVVHPYGGDRMYSVGYLRLLDQ